MYIRIWLRSNVDKSVGACGTWTSTVLYISSHSSCLFSEKKSRINNNILNPKDWPMMHWKSEQWTQQQKTRFLCFARKNSIFKAKSASFSLGVKYELFNFPTILEEKGKGSSFNSAKKSFHVINFHQNWSAKCKERKASSRIIFTKMFRNFSWGKTNYRDHKSRYLSIFFSELLCYRSQTNVKAPSRQLLLPFLSTSFYLIFTS